MLILIRLESYSRIDYDDAFIQPTCDDDFATSLVIIYGLLHDEAPLRQEDIY